ncbi:hypothetical protein B0H10DRAFT_2091467 [Mycena sp. CBHHK59/15]|nr:hypothetical protein B0H10DRAFT_2091467 [Mycena sp. CBHHK59/15]
MFKFNFDIEDDGNDVTTAETAVTTPVAQSEPFLDALPPLISYSPLAISLSSARRNVTLARRDLFDARFQLISEGRCDEPPPETSKPASALGFLDAPSDLVPGVYEGGLKTWECSLDLVDHLDGLKDTHSLQVGGKCVLEIGCGTGVPSVYLLHQLFSEENTIDSETYVHFQDYNASVLELITFPNIILAWYMSPSSAEYRASVSNSPESELPNADPTVPGELPITSSLKSAFTASLVQRRINLAFFSGSWESLTAHLGVAAKKYDVVLTSETIYRAEALPALINLMRVACAESRYVCLVAAKILYFGVGGGVSEFVRALQSKEMREGGCSGNVETVWERSVGVGRKIMKIEWV